LAQSIIGMDARGTYLFRGPYLTQMLTHPSTETMDSAAREAGASVAFLVVSDRFQNPPLSKIVESTKEVLDMYAILGDGKLYIFRYPGVEPEMAIPIRIDSGDYTRQNCLLEYEVNWTREFSVLTNAHLDPNSVRVVAPEGDEVPSQHDYFQGWFDDCSTSASWSEGSSDGDVLTFTVRFNATTMETGHLVYTEFERDGGDLIVDTSKFEYMEIKWKENYEEVANIRVVLWKKDEGGWKPGTTWASPSTEWGVWRCDIYSLVNGTLGGLSFDVFKAKPYTWIGDYEVRIDWIRFISDTGVVRFLYNGTANSVEHYRIEYDSLENTESGKQDGLPRPSYPNGISWIEQTNHLNFTSNWSDHIVNFVINKTATEWNGSVHGTSFSYTLQIDSINILTSDSNQTGGLGVMRSEGSASSSNVKYTNAHLISEGPIMAEVCFEANGYDDLYIQFYVGECLSIALQTEGEHGTWTPNAGNYSWFISTNTLDDKVYYLNEDGEAVGKDMYESRSCRSWRAQSIGQIEEHGYLVVLSNVKRTPRTYGATYNKSGLDALDFIYLNGSLAGDKLRYVISKNQSLKELENITLEVKDDSSISSEVPVSLAIRTIDLLNQPIGDATISVLELGIDAHTDTDGWVQVPILRGQWTLVASKHGVVDEKKVDLLMNSATVQRLNIIEIGEFTVNVWEFILIFGLIILACALMLLLIDKKALFRTKHEMQQN